MITWWEAWSQWFSGQEVDGQLTMGPWSILTWARVGKVAAFIGGATVILDLVGPERLRLFARSRMNRRASRWIAWDLKSWRSWVLATGTLLLVSASWLWSYPLAFRGDSPLSGTLFRFFPLAISVFSTIRALQVLTGVLTILLARLLDVDRPAQAIRYVAIALLAAGFHFDLLAS